MQVQTVARALEIHPFILSGGRRDVREGRIVGELPAAPAPGPAREIALLQGLETAHARGGAPGHLAIVMDQHPRRILAWSLTRQRTAAVTCAVLSAAARQRPAATGVIFHSDRGSEYMGTPFATRVAALGLLQSPSVRGPGDNAYAESFFHSLKAELIRGTHFATEAALRGALRRSQMKTLAVASNKHRQAAGGGVEGHGLSGIRGPASGVPGSAVRQTC